MTVTSKLKFIHYLQHCVLTTTGKQLPKWLILGSFHIKFNYKYDVIKSDLLQGLRTTRSNM